MEYREMKGPESREEEVASSDYPKFADTSWRTEYPRFSDAQNAWRGGRVQGHVSRGALCADREGSFDRVPERA